jgi:hypothetical protein
VGDYVVRYNMFKSETAALAIFLALLAPASSLAGSEHAFGRAAGANCGWTGALPDTAQRVCYSTTTASPTTPVSRPCPTFLAGQDGSYASVASSPTYTLNGTTTTTDNVTGLMWVSTGNNNGNTADWTTAVSVCENLTFWGYTDWRLPDVRELTSILDYGRTSSPIINVTAFPNTSASYWTSTTDVNTPANAIIVGFASGSLGSIVKTTLEYVRCVRGGPW